jgi:hypothetical protein
VRERRGEGARAKRARREEKRREQKRAGSLAGGGASEASKKRREEKRREEKRRRCCGRSGPDLGGVLLRSAILGLLYSLRRFRLFLMSRRHKAAVRIQSRVRMWSARKRLVRLQKMREFELQGEAQIIIGKNWRMSRDRREFLRRLREHKRRLKAIRDGQEGAAAGAIQARERGRAERKR